MTETVMTFGEYLELYDKDYGPFLVNKKAVPTDPLKGNWHMEKRKMVDWNTLTVTLFDSEKEETI